MPNPFTAEAPPSRADRVFEATDAAKNYLRDLMLDKAFGQGRDMTQAAADIDHWLVGHAHKHVVSENIDRLKAEGHTGWAHKNAAVAAVHDEDIEDFIYVLPDERIVKVIHAVHGSGRQYGKLLDTVTGKFNVAPGIVGEVRKAGRKLSLEHAQKLGQIYGMCCVCGRTLTDEDSIAAGIGPICAQKF